MLSKDAKWPVLWKVNNISDITSRKAFRPKFAEYDDTLMLFWADLTRFLKFWPERVKLMFRELRKV